MFRIENISENCLYIKAIGTFPPPVAENFVEKFEEKTKEMKKFGIIVDLLDASLLNFKSFNIILELLKKDNEKLEKSAFVIAKNPPLDAEFQILLIS